MIFPLVSTSANRHPRRLLCARETIPVCELSEISEFKGRKAEQSAALGWRFGAVGPANGAQCEISEGS